MTTQEIQNLLDRYFEGETSLSEEALLKQYFQGNDVDPVFQAYQPFFRFLDSERQAALSPSFEEKILQTIRQEKQLRIRKITARLARVAALAVLLIGIAVLFPKKPQPAEAVAINWEQYEPQTDEEAVAEATAALKLLAAKLNGSAKTASEELDKIQKSAEAFK